MRNRNRNSLDLGLTLAAVCVLAGGAWAVPIAADFNDGTMGDLDSVVAMSVRSIGAGNLEVTNKAHGLPDADDELYIKYGYGSPGNDNAVIDTDNTFGDVVVEVVMGQNESGYKGGGAGVVAGIPAGGGGGYLLYAAGCWSDGGGMFWDDTLTTASQDDELILVRKEPGTDYPLDAANTLRDTVVLNGFVDDTPNFIRLTVSGNSVKGEIWLDSGSAVGDPDATVQFIDPSPLTGHAGVYIACRNKQTSWGAELAVDDFAADVPEPAGLSVLAAGGLLLLRRRR